MGRQVLPDFEPTPLLNVGKFEANDCDDSLIHLLEPGDEEKIGRWKKTNQINTLKKRGSVCQREYIKTNKHA